MKRLALLLAVGVVLAGCGGSSRLSKSAYEAKLQADGRSVQTSVTKLTKHPPTSLSDLATRVDQTESVVKKAADDIGSLKPPSDAVADNAAIVTFLRRVQSGLEQVKKNPTAASSIVAAIEKSPQLKAALKATADLKSKGYKVGVIGAP
jgi:hypothetical protein